MPLLPAQWRPLAGPPSLESCSRDVYDPALRFTRPEIVERLARDTAAAAAHLHARALLHGDLYAHNILWDGATGDSVLSDFGAACCLPAGAHGWPCSGSRFSPGASFWASCWIGVMNRRRTFGLCTANASRPNRQRGRRCRCRGRTLRWVGAAPPGDAGDPSAQIFCRRRVQKEMAVGGAAAGSRRGRAASPAPRPRRRRPPPCAPRRPTAPRAARA